ncbi:MAG: hypothetical protein CVU51_04145 [Deltaproteobacteria bacterium HGW-Deltaproteobacteria-1]|jgi:hypothetical protein|nr:MAG: hypothetical protein CVU51_04145 [Deltaproteobacteria bacterium HGW-Deltaproteobacteria-1]
MKKAGSIGSAFFAHFKWLSLILGGASKCDIVGGVSNRRPYFLLQNHPQSWDERCEWLITDFPLLLAATAFLNSIIRQF